MPNQNNSSIGNTYRFTNDTALAWVTTWIPLMPNTSDNQTSHGSQDLFRVQVDANVCIASGQCEMLEGETFYIDDETVIARVIGDGLLPRERAEAVANACPSNAISIVDESTDPAG